MSWSWEAQDLDRLAVQADARLMDDLASRRPVAADDPAAAVLVALAREVDAIPIPPGWFVTGSASSRWPGARSRLRRTVAATGAAAAVGMLVVGGAAANVTGVPIGSLINDVIGSVFDGGSHTTTADLIPAQLADAKAALAAGNIEAAAQILDDIKTRVDLSDPGSLPPTLLDQIEELESLIDAAAGAQSPVPLVTPASSPAAPDATSGGGADGPSGQNHDHVNQQGNGDAPAEGAAADANGDDQASGTTGSPSSDTRNDRPSHPADVPASDPTPTSGGLAQDGLSLVSPSPAGPSLDRFASADDAGRLQPGALPDVADSPSQAAVDQHGGSTNEPNWETAETELR